MVKSCGIIKTAPSGQISPSHGNISSSTSLASGINDLINDFKMQVMTLLQKQEQINNLTQIVENVEKKTNYVLNIIDSMYSQNE